MDNTKIINPSISFYKIYEDNIQKTRETLFSELDGISSSFGNEARNILENKIKSNNHTPLLGELFPWIIKDLIKSDITSTHKISVGWLAIYLYTLFLDEHVDNPKPLDPIQFITGSLLAKSGLLKISLFTNNTPYEKYIDKAFSFSAKNQLLDCENKEEDINLSIKEKYSKGKNYVILSCAGALAAQNPKHADFITSFSNNLLLTLQYLDDIADYPQDFANKNFTVLLNDAFKGNPNFLQTIHLFSDKDVLVELISSGALYRVVNKIIALLNHSIALINENNLRNNSASFDFFYTLHSYALSLNKILKSNQLNFKNLSIEKREIILDKVINHITIIAQSS